MRRRVVAPLVLLLALIAPVVQAEDYPRVVFPQGHALVADAGGAVTVGVPLLQIELRPGWVLAATRGTRFALADAGEDAGLDVQVAGGELTMLNLHDNALLRIPKGSYRLAAAGGHGVSIRPQTDDEATPLPAEAGTLSPGYRLSDAVMTQQQKYLDSLKIDVRDLNKALASLIRGLVPKQ